MNDKKKMPSLEEFLENHMLSFQHFAKTVGGLCFLYLAATTTFYVYQGVSVKIGGVHPALFWGITIAISLFIYMLIDRGNFNLLVSRVQAWVINREDNLKPSKEDSTRKRIAKWSLRLLTFCIVARLATSVLFSWYSTPDIGKATVSGDSKFYIQQAKDTEIRSKNTIAEAKAAYEAMKESEAQRIKLAAKKASDAFDKAYENGDIWQKESYDKLGLTWLLSKANASDKSDVAYGTAIKNALDSKKTLISAEKQKTEDAKANWTGSSSTKNSDLLYRLAEKSSTEEAESVTRRTRLFYVGDIIAALLGFLCAFIVALTKIYFREFKNDPTPQEKLKKKISSTTFAIKDYFSPTPLKKPTRSNKQQHNKPKHPNQHKPRIEDAQKNSAEQVIIDEIEKDRQREIAEEQAEKNRWEKRRKAGFKISQDSSTPPVMNEVKKLPTKDDKNYTDVVDELYSELDALEEIFEVPFAGSELNIKQLTTPEYTSGIQCIQLDDIQVDHTQKDGSTVKVNIRYVRGQISSYKLKLKTATDKSRPNRQEKLNYWEGKLEEIIEKSTKKPHRVG